MTASIPSKPWSRRTTGMPPPPTATTSRPASRSVRTAPSSTTSSGLGDGTTRRQPRPGSSFRAQPRSAPAHAPGAVVVRADRLRRVLEGRVGGVDRDVRDDDRDGLPRHGLELRGRERADLRLGLGDREPERERGRLRGPELLAQELVADLRPVPVRDDDLALEERRHGRERRPGWRGARRRVRAPRGRGARFRPAPGRSAWVVLSG